MLFRDVFSLPAPQGLPFDGICKARPFRLDGISKADFELFARILGRPRESFQTQTPTLTVSEYESVLKLATMWDFDDIRNWALGCMTLMDIPPTRRITMAKIYNFQEWYWVALYQLAEVPGYLTAEEISGWEIGFVRRVERMQGFCEGLQSSKSDHSMYRPNPARYSKFKAEHILRYFPELKDIPLTHCCAEVRWVCRTLDSQGSITSQKARAVDNRCKPPPKEQSERNFVILGRTRER